MIEQHTEEEQTLRAIDRFYATQVNICIAALNRMQSAELADKNIIIRAIMCDMPDCGICADPAAEDYGVDFWADRAEYVMNTDIQSLCHAGRREGTVEHREERPKTGASGGSAAADHRAGRRDKQAL